MSSEEQDMKAKEAARNSARATKPGAVSVAADEAARLDQRIAEKRELVEGGGNNNSNSNISPDRESEISAKQRGARAYSTPAKPGAYAEVSSSTPATQLQNLERDVAAKVRASGATSRPGATAVTAAADAAVTSKVSRSSTPGTQAVESMNDAAASKVRRDAVGSSANTELANLENEVVSKVRSVPAATTPGAVASLRSMEDSIAGKVQQSSEATTASPGARAQLQAVEDSVSAKIRREASSEGVTPGAQARLQRIEDSVAAKIRRETTSSATTTATAGAVSELQAAEDAVAAKVRGSHAAVATTAAGARAELGNLEDSVANKIRENNGSVAVAPGARSELSRLEDSVATKVQGTNPTEGALSELNRMEYTVTNKTDAPRSSLVQSELNRFENAVRSKENLALDGPIDNQVAAKTSGMVDGIDKAKLDSRPEQSLDKEDELTAQGTPNVITTADHGIVTSPDLEYGMMGGAAGEGLAVAVAVEEEEDDMFIPSAVEYDPDAKPPMYKNRRFRLYAFLAFFIIVVVVIGASVAATFGKSGANSTPAPTPAPTTVRESLGIQSSIERVVGEDLLKDPKSPYAKALDWMIFDDPMELTPDDPNFIQRYTAAYFYFATSEKGPWRSCNPPQDPKTDSTNCVYKKLAFLFPEEYDDQPWHSWLSNINECEWAGVLCDEQGQVRSLDLSGSMLSGTFPEGVYNFPFLQELSLFWNNFTGPLPVQLTEMDHLVSLELHYNKFTGSVPNEWWQSRNLQRINVGENMITGSIPTDVGNLRDIKGLFLMTNLMTGSIPEEIGVLDSVTYFRLSRNELDGSLPTTFTGLENVVEIWLHRNLLTGSIPDDIGKLQLLGDLRLHVNPMSGELPESIWDLASLWRMELYQCNFTGTISESIGKLGQGFFELHLNENMFEGSIPQNISGLTDIYTIWIQGNNLTGTIPEALCSLKGDSLSEILTEFDADCSPDSKGYVELSCPSGCCTTCCKPDGTDCLPVTSDV